MRCSERSILGIWLLAATGLFGGELLAGEPPRDVSSEALSFDYFRNNWNVIGLKDYQRGARVMPDNRIMLAGPDVAVQVCFGNRLMALGRQHDKFAQDGWMPIMVVAADDGPVHYEFTYWATPLPTVKDWHKAFDWPTDGENFVVWIRCQVTNTSAGPAEAKVRIALDPAYRHPRGPESPKEPAVDKSLHGSYSLTEMLPAGGTVVGAARFAFFPIPDSASLDKEDHALWLERTINYWRAMMNSIAHIEVPCRKATDAARAAHVCQLIASDHGQMRGGEGFYDQFYLRDAANQLLALEEAGHIEMARNAVKYFLQRQQTDGRFAGGGNQGGQFDANGQTQWMLWQFYKITGDRAFLARVYPNMLRAARWTMKARRVEPNDSPYAGVLPSAPADGECLWDGKHHIVGYDLWNLRGVRCTADAARILRRDDEAEELREEAESYRAAIDGALEKAGLDYFPPSWEEAGTHWGNTETLWTTELFARDDPRIAEQSRFLREDFAGGFIEGTIQWKGGGKDAIHPYMGAYTVMNDLARGRHEQVVEDFYWYLVHTTAANAFPEGIYYKTRTAWSNTIPHVTGACNYVFLLRHMLVHEAENELHLLSAVPDWWLDEGQEIRIERAPTHFGMMGMIVRGKKDGVELELDLPRRNPPGRIVLHLPQSRPLLGTLDRGEVVVRSNQKKRWDFPAVVALYEKSDPPPLWAEPDAVSLTTGKPVTCSSSLPGCPARQAADGYASDPGRHWATDVRQLNDPVPWWQVDLENPTTVGRVVVIGYHGDKRYYGFTVETSLDGKTWQMVADRRENQAVSTAEGYTCRFESRPVRYIRIAQPHHSANTGRHLVEVAAFEQ